MNPQQMAPFPQFYEDYNYQMYPNYDITVPIPSKGNYKNSIEYQFPFEYEDQTRMTKDIYPQTENYRFPTIEIEPLPIKYYGPERKIDLSALEWTNGMFDLEADVKEKIMNSKMFSEVEKRVIKNLINFKAKGLSKEEKDAAIRRYRLKKRSRRVTYQIRYKVRQDLAVKRLRNKGKFIKSKKMDIRAVANMLLKNDEEIERNKLKRVSE